MASGYAARLTKGVDYGVCGLPEEYDEINSLMTKIETLVTLIRKSKHLVVYTGAGISTSVGIPDFRGPNGVWTRELQEKKKNSKRHSGAELPPPHAEVPFEWAVPSLTHMALLGLYNAGILKYLVSQNVDGLHIRSGFPREALSELHGNVFIEECSRESCKKKYIRRFEVESIGFKPTGRLCECGAPLIDTLLDWMDALPEDQLERAEKESEAADLALALGTSLRVHPANGLPVRCTRSGGRLVIVNLQPTPKDRHASLRIRAKTDFVMKHVMESLKIPIPVYRRVEKLVFVTDTVDQDSVRVSVRSADGFPPTFVDKVELHCPGHPETASSMRKEPFSHVLPAGRDINVTVHFPPYCHLREFTQILQPPFPTELIVDLELQKVDYSCYQPQHPDCPSRAMKRKKVDK